MKPRILFVANGILGWNTYSRQLAEVLAGRDDVDARVLWRRPDRLSTLVVKRHSVGPLARLFRRVDSVTAYRLWLGREIRRAVADQAPDVVHFASHWPAAALTWAPGAPPYTVSLDATRPNMDDIVRRGVWSRREIEREGDVFRRAARIFPMSDWAARSVITDHGVPAGQVSVSPPSIDLNAFRAPTGGRACPNVLFIGNDFIRKGGDRLCRWVDGPLAGTCHLHIVSNDPRAKVESAHITCHGGLPHDVLLKEVLPEMDIFCLPTRLDMSPHVLAEAAAAGLPSVASDLGGIPDLVVDGQTGRLVAPDDDAGFVAALRGLIGSAETRLAMRAAALAHARARFDASRNFNQLVDALAEIAVGNRAEQPVRKPSAGHGT